MADRCEPELGAHGLVKAVGAGEVPLPVGLAVGVTVVGRTVDDRWGERYVQSVAK